MAFEKSFRTEAPNDCSDRTGERNLPKFNQNEDKDNYFYDLKKRFYTWAKHLYWINSPIRIQCSDSEFFRCRKMNRVSFIKFPDDVSALYSQTDRCCLTSARSLPPVELLPLKPQTTTFLSSFSPSPPISSYIQLQSTWAQTGSETSKTALTQLQAENRT